MTRPRVDRRMRAHLEETVALTNVVLDVMDRFGIPVDGGRPTDEQLRRKVTELVLRRDWSSLA